jgi:prepilin-type processing-associated H-X9-DG protein
MNGSGGTGDIDTPNHPPNCPNGIGYSGFSVQMTSVEDTAGTIVLAPRPKKNNRLGSNIGAHIRQPETSYTAELINYDKTGLHGKFMFNYLFADGHVKIYNYRATCPDPTNNKPKGMWSRQAD